MTLMLWVCLLARPAECRAERIPTDVSGRTHMAPGLVVAVTSS
ncbi:MAG: hypothetical protein OJJ21_16955 [Ferrovibrio sp.]|nr:hypothetical protein [Ferrovibrio sp.]MCW0235291.1 hypothetical protein [Ferrovibrio sp.]